MCRPSLGGRSVEFKRGDLETLVRLVDAVGWLTLLPEVALWTLSPAQRTRLRPLSPPVAGRTVYLLFREGSLKAPLLRALSEEARRAFALLRSNASAQESAMMVAEFRHDQG